MIVHKLTRACKTLLKISIPTVLNLVLVCYLGFILYSLLVIPILHREQECVRCLLIGISSNYLKMNVPNTDEYPRYSLYWHGNFKNFTEDNLKPNGRCQPVLFVPGNAGSHQQVINFVSGMNSHMDMRKSIQKNDCFEFYSIDFDEEMVIFSEDLLILQAKYVNLVSIWLSTMQHSYSKSLIFVGHSYGGVVMRLAIFIQDNREIFKDFNILMITIASPHNRPPVPFNSIYSLIHRFVKNYWTKILMKKLPFKSLFFISVFSGLNDIQVPKMLSYVDPTRQTGPYRSMNLSTLQIQQAWSNPNHGASISEMHIVLMITEFLQKCTVADTSNSQTYLVDVDLMAKEAQRVFFKAFKINHLLIGKSQHVATPISDDDSSNDFRSQKNTIKLELESNYDEIHNFESEIWKFSNRGNQIIQAQSGHEILTWKIFRDPKPVSTVRLVPCPSPDLPPFKNFNPPVQLISKFRYFYDTNLESALAITSKCLIYGYGTRELSILRGDEFKDTELTETNDIFNQIFDLHNDDFNSPKIDENLGLKNEDAIRTFCQKHDLKWTRPLIKILEKLYQHEKLVENQKTFKINLSNSIDTLSLMFGKNIEFNDRVLSMEMRSKIATVLLLSSTDNNTDTDNIPIIIQKTSKDNDYNQFDALHPEYGVLSGTVDEHWSSSVIIEGNQLLKLFFKKNTTKKVNLKIELFKTMQIWVINTLPMLFLFAYAYTLGISSRVPRDPQSLLFIIITAFTENKFMDYSLLGVVIRLILIVLIFTVLHTLHRGISLIAYILKSKPIPDNDHEEMESKSMKSAKSEITGEKEDRDTMYRKVYHILVLLFCLTLLNTSTCMALILFLYVIFGWKIKVSTIVAIIPYAIKFIGIMMNTRSISKKWGFYEGLKFLNFTSGNIFSNASLPSKIRFRFISTEILYFSILILNLSVRIWRSGENQIITLEHQRRATLIIYLGVCLLSNIHECPSNILILEMVPMIINSLNSEDFV